MLLIVHQCFLMMLSRKIIVRKATLQTTNKFFLIERQSHHPTYASFVKGTKCGNRGYYILNTFCRHRVTKLVVRRPWQDLVVNEARDLSIVSSHPRSTGRWKTSAATKVKKRAINRINQIIQLFILGSTAVLHLLTCSIISDTISPGHCCSSYNNQLCCNWHLILIHDTRTLEGLWAL